MVTTVVEPAVTTTAVVVTSTTKSYYPSDNRIGSFSYLGSSKTRTLTLNPDRFDQLKANGYMPPLAYYAKRVSANLQPGTLILTWPASLGVTNTMTNVDHMYCNPTSVVSFSHAAAAKAVASAVANANSKLRMQQMSLVEDLAEGRQTYNLVFGSMKKLVSAFGSFKKGQYRKGLKTLGLDPKSLKSGATPAQAWLAYRYGVVPLMSEVHGAMTLLQGSLKSERVVRHVTGTGTSDVTVTSKSSSVAMSGSHACYGTLFYSKRATATFKCSVGYVYTIKNDAVQTLTQLGLTNPLLVAWELVTLSFVVDWFVNVSDVLEQLDAWSAASWLSGYQTLKLTEDVYNTTTGYTPPSWAGAVGSLSNASGNLRREEINRITLTKAPSIGLVVRPKLNWKRLTDTAALLRTFLGPRKGG